MDINNCLFETTKHERRTVLGQSEEEELIKYTLEVLSDDKMIKTRPDSSSLCKMYQCYAASIIKPTEMKCSISYVIVCPHARGY